MDGPHMITTAIYVQRIIEHLPRGINFDLLHAHRIIAAAALLTNNFLLDDDLSLEDMCHVLLLQIPDGRKLQLKVLQLLDFDLIISTAQYLDFVAHALCLPGVFGNALDLLNAALNRPTTEDRGAVVGK